MGEQQDIIGFKGPVGHTGNTGADGITGFDSEMGYTGKMGATGKMGRTGCTGYGRIGPEGNTGPIHTGYTGPIGHTGRFIPTNAELAENGYKLINITPLEADDGIITGIKYQTANSEISLESRYGAFWGYRQNLWMIKDKFFVSTSSASVSYTHLRAHET